MSRHVFTLKWTCQTEPGTNNIIVVNPTDLQFQYENYLKPKTENHFRFGKVFCLSIPLCLYQHMNIGKKFP